MSFLFKERVSLDLFSVRSVKIIDYYGNGSKYGVNITYIKEDDAMGSAGAIRLAGRHLNETFILTNGDELKDIDIEISVLTQPKTVKSWKDIVIDRDGIILKKGWAAAVFLPQVAPEQKWTLEETLSYLARKAGLSKNTWRQDAKFEVFQADVFGEKQRK